MSLVKWIVIVSLLGTSRLSHAVEEDNFAPFDQPEQTTPAKPEKTSTSTTTTTAAPVVPDTTVQPVTPTSNETKALDPNLLGTDKARWSFVLPAFVMHGEVPGGGANQYMPRRITDDGRFVATPGFGFEYEGKKSLDMLFAAIKDCYDDYAGTLQVGQYFTWGQRVRFGYTLGLYVRQTPIACLTTTSTSGGGGHPGPPQSQNTLITTACVIEDNLPIRYTTTIGGQYIDIIPTPFLNLSALVYNGSSVKVYIKLISNYYLNEFGISLPF